MIKGFSMNIKGKRVFTIWLPSLRGVAMVAVCIGLGVGGYLALKAFESKFEGGLQISGGQ